MTYRNFPDDDITQFSCIACHDVLERFGYCTGVGVELKYGLIYSRLSRLEIEMYKRRRMNWQVDYAQEKWCMYHLMSHRCRQSQT